MIGFNPQNSNAPLAFVTQFWNKVRNGIPLFTRNQQALQTLGASINWTNVAPTPAPPASVALPRGIVPLFSINHTPAP